MTESLIISAAIEELTAKNFGATEQFLEVHEIVQENGHPVVAAVVPEEDGRRTIVYFPVKGEDFFLVVYVNTLDAKVVWVNTENYYSICLIASSDTMSLADIAAKTSLPVTRGWNKGEMVGIRIMPSAVARFEPHTTPGTFEEKLEALLTFLEQDKQGVQALVKEADAGIQVAAIFHNGNTMLGGVHLTSNYIQRMAALGLSIDFDLYAEGNFFKEDTDWA